MKLGREKSERIGAFIREHHELPTAVIAAKTGCAPFEVMAWKRRHAGELLKLKGEREPGRGSSYIGHWGKSKMSEEVAEW